MRQSAISIVEQDGKYLCVWNPRFDGWSLPGGMVETDETLEQAQARELREETRLVTLNRKLVFEGTFELPSRPDRSSHVHVFRVTTVGVAGAMEEGCPIAWLTREELLTQSPFAAFYTTMFAKFSAAPA
jgi:ADP-ribose pyrophosphatase YjhB (NUDIX family)